MVGRFFMLKKFFAVFFAGIILVTTGTHAEDNSTRQMCTGSQQTNFYTTNSSSRPAISADYKIYFDNNKSIIPNECKSDVDRIIQDLHAKSADIETVLLFGSASAVGGAKINAQLAQDRVNTINKMLTDAGITTCKYETDSDGKATALEGRCAHISMGDSLYRAVVPTNNSDSTWYHRAVFMFVIYKGDICDASTIDALNRLSAKVSDPSIKSLLNNATEICNNNKKDQLLLRSQREQIMDAIAAAIKKYPELSEGMSAGVLADAIIAIRDSLALSVSVWKNAEGKFNYARLASDSIAGVVLGTAGGLITSSVVKKNQIKNGFEDIMCTVGGQNVANWGDEFRVGIK